MPGTKEGGLAAAETIKKKHGDDFFKRIGAKGGKSGNSGGFAANRELARTAGAKGGKSGNSGGFAANRELARTAGAKGGRISRRKKVN